MNLNFLDHNPNHSVHIGKHRFCCRCLGLYLGGLIAFVILGFAVQMGLSADFGLVFILSWLFASVCIFDWMSVKLGLREGSNKIRVLTGSSLGVGYALYFWLLPIDLVPKLISLLFINFIFAIIIYLARCKQYDVSITRPYDLALEITASKQYACPCCACPCCCGSSCCGGNTLIAIIACIVCCGCCCGAVAMGMGGICGRCK